MFDWFRNRVSRRRVAEAAMRMMNRIRGKYDAAKTTDDNRRHWLDADAASPEAANTPEVRKKLRERARYETQNWAYMDGLVQSMGNDAIGTGPKLQVLIDDRNTAAFIERQFKKWATEIGLTDKLNVMRQARLTDGESFGKFITNNKLRHPVKLDIALIECEQVSDGVFFTPEPNRTDGIEFDEVGNPTFYKVLKYHPGDTFYGVSQFDEPVRVPASQIIHYFKPRRAGQHRAIPELTSGISVGANTRRYTAAVLAAAETAADFAAVMKTSSPPGEVESASELPLLEIEKRMLVPLPDGYDITQLRAEQPTTTHKEFKEENLGEVGAGVCATRNIVTGNSSGYNYSSGRLDHQKYHRKVDVDREHIERIILDRIFVEWLREAVLIGSFLLTGAIEDIHDVQHEWFWDGFEHVDPQKEASARETDLRNNMTTYAAEYAKKGQDWETQLRQRAKEAALMKELGLTVEAATPQAKEPQPVEDDSNG